MRSSWDVVFILSIAALMVSSSIVAASGDTEIVTGDFSLDNLLDSGDAEVPRNNSSSTAEEEVAAREPGPLVQLVS